MVWNNIISKRLSTHLDIDFEFGNLIASVAIIMVLFCTHNELCEIEFMEQISNSRSCVGA